MIAESDAWTLSPQTRVWAKDNILQQLRTRPIKKVSVSVWRFEDIQILYFAFSGPNQGLLDKALERHGFAQEAASEPPRGAIFQVNDDLKTVAYYDTSYRYSPMLEQEIEEAITFLMGYLGWLPQPLNSQKKPRKKKTSSP